MGAYKEENRISTHIFLSKQLVNFKKYRSKKDKHKTVKLLEQRKGENFYNLWLYKHFLYKT